MKSIEPFYRREALLWKRLFGPSAMYIGHKIDRHWLANYKVVW
jgi:hypothetical protein